jgi:hypothetical protein
MQDLKVNVKIKLSALWATAMFLYIYVDYFYLYVPGGLEKIIAGKMGPFQTNQVALLAALTLMMIPSLMIILSLTLPPKANRWTNIIVGILKTVVVIGAAIGESWAFYIFGSIVEVVLTLLVVWYAWKWPKQEG